MDAGYLTTGQVAQLLGVSKGAILRAVQRSELRAAWTMPGGAQRFLPADVETYAGRVASRKRLQPVETVLLQRATGSQALQRETDGPAPLHPPVDKAEDAPPDQAAAAGFERLSAAAGGSHAGIEVQIADILALLADSLQVGLACLARPVNGTWLVEECHDRMGMSVRSGEPLPFSEVYGEDLRAGRLSSLLVEDVQADARFAVSGAVLQLGIGAMTLVTLNRPDGELYGALCTLHPHARAVPGGEPALLQLAGRMVMHVREAAALRAAEQRAAQQLAASEARLALQYAIVAVLATAETLDDALPRLLCTIGSHLRWVVGECWMVDGAGQVLQCRASWHSAAVKATAWTVPDAPPISSRGVGLRGRVWDSGEQVWVEDLSVDGGLLPSGLAVRASLLAAFAQPIHVGNVVSGVLTFFSQVARPPSALMLQALSAAGGQIGQFVERMKAEEANRASEARFRALCDHSADFIRIVDADGIIRYANPSHERLLGYPAEELVGRSSYAIMHPDDVPAMRRLLEQTVCQPDAFGRGEMRMRHADGSWRTLEVVLHNRLDDPAMRGVLSNGRDISKRDCARDAARE